MTVSGAIDGVLRTCDEAHDVISAKSRVSIVPLGLTDAIYAFLRGTSPQYRHEAHRLLHELLANSANDTPEDESELDAVAAAHDELNERFDNIESSEFVSPMLNIVENLPMAETLRLADSLVGLASLRQLIQGQSSVGGPVDLGRVTKQSGFEWVRTKRSHGVSAITAPADGSVQPTRADQ